jgi:hypothetical protein
MYNFNYFSKIDAWKKVTERVNKLREMNNFKLLSHQGISSISSFYFIIIKYSIN